MQFRELSERIRHSLWFVPTLSVIVAAVAAIGMVALSSAFPDAGADMFFVFGAGPDGARAMLQAIGGSIITVAGTVFSITIVALQLTSSQFSPRVLRNFLRDRGNQLVLGVFIGTFTYALLVLRTIRTEDEGGGAAFVPGPAITFGLVLAFVSVGTLIFFIHHISVRIQVTTILASVAGDAVAAVKELASWNERDDDRAWQAATAPVPPTPSPPSGASPSAEASSPHASPIRARESGYLQLVDLGGLVKAAGRLGGRYRLLVAPGAWVQDRAPIATFAPAVGAPEPEGEHASRLTDALGLGAERSLQQDAAFGIQQIVDIAVKSLSPSVNDPTTAMNCIDRLVEVLVAAGTRPDAPRAFADGDGVVRLEIPFPGFDELIGLALDQVRHYGGTTPAVTIHLARALSQLLATLPAARHPALRDQARLLAEAAAGTEPASARERVLSAVAALLG